MLVLAVLTGNYSGLRSVDGNLVGLRLALRCDADEIGSLGIEDSAWRKWSS